MRIQDELVTYERYTATPPYQFLGCERGALGSRASSYAIGSRIGLLDVDIWPIFVRLSQDTDIQEEIAQRLGVICRDAGFKFVYFDGAEDVPGPEYWYTVSRAQWLVYKSKSRAAVLVRRVQVAFQLAYSDPGKCLRRVEIGSVEKRRSVRIRRQKRHGRREILLVSILVGSATGRRAMRRSARSRR